MNKTTSIKLGITLAGVLTLIVSRSHGDTFGTTGNEFTIDFVDVGNAGNAADPSTGYGAVPYTYRMGTYEISRAAITKSGVATAGPVAWAGIQPVANITWYETAIFVNWLNTSTGHHAAYDMVNPYQMNLWSSGEAWQAGGENRFRHKNAYYFLPSENEWRRTAQAILPRAAELSRQCGKKGARVTAIASRGGSASLRGSNQENTHQWCRDARQSSADEQTVFDDVVR